MDSEKDEDNSDDCPKNEVTSGQASKASKEIEGTFRYEQDSKRYHRFKIETDAGAVGTVYVPKERQGEQLQKCIILEYADKDE